MCPGLCALSISNDNCYLAYPGSATIGEVQVFDTVNLVGEHKRNEAFCPTVYFFNIALVLNFSP